MRISTQQMHQRGVELMLEQQARLSHIQQQVATGKRLLTASDDPGAAVQALRLEREMASSEQYQVTGEAVRARQSAEENVLAGVTDLLHNVRELMVQGNNDTMTAADRRALAQSLDQRLEELLGLANTRNGSGEFLFAGFKSTTQPFSHDGRGNFAYHGDEGSRRLEIGPDVSVAATTSGSEVFLGLRAGNGTFVTSADPANSGAGTIGAGRVIGAFVPDDYSLRFSQAAPDAPLLYEVRDSGGTLVADGEYASGATIQFNGVEIDVSGSPVDGDGFAIQPAGYGDMFSVIHRAAQTLGKAADDPTGRARLHSELNRGLAELDGALEQALLQRAKTGSRLNLVESQQDANEVFQTAAAEALSNVQDLDYAKAAMELQTQMLGLEAAQQSFISIQNLSLFRFLR